MLKILDEHPELNEFTTKQLTRWQRKYETRPYFQNGPETVKIISLIIREIEKQSPEFQTILKEAIIKLARQSELK